MIEEKVMGEEKVLGRKKDKVIYMKLKVNISNKSKTIKMTFFNHQNQTKIKVICG